MGYLENEDGMGLKIGKCLCGLLLVVLALSGTSCRRAAERARQNIRIETVEKIERIGISGAEVVVRVNNGSRYKLALTTAEFGLYYADARVGTIVLMQPVEVPRRSVVSVTTRWRLKISDPMALYLLLRKTSDGDWSQIAVSCSVEGRGGPAPVKFSREKMPLSDFLNTFGVSIRDVENYLK